MRYWVLSKFFRDGDRLLPVAGAYGAYLCCPLYPATDDGWALVELLSDPQRMEAAGQDSRIVVCPAEADPQPVAETVITAYADRGATSGLSMAALLAVLAAGEPRFARG